jgi:hypothetical protein
MGTGKTIGDTAADPTREATGVVGLEPGLPGVQEPLADLGDSERAEFEGRETPAGRNSSRAFGETEFDWTLEVNGELFLEKYYEELH